MSFRVHQPEDFHSYSIDQESQPFDLLKSIVVPRPIALVTTKNPNDVINAAPFSFFNIVCMHPPMISISIGRRKGNELKDTARNIRTNKEFVANICSPELAKILPLVAQTFPPHTSEVEAAELSLIPSDIVAVPRLANTLVQMECRLDQIIEVGDDPHDLILAKVVKIHTHKQIIDEQGNIDIEKLNPLARVSGTLYSQISHTFDPCNKRVDELCNLN